jgi:hypothetical protein
LTPGPLNDIDAPLVLNLVIMLLPESATQRFPSDPATIPAGCEMPESLNSVSDPPVVTRTIVDAAFPEVTHNAPSGPAVIEYVATPAATGNDVTAPRGEI